MTEQTQEIPEKPVQSEEVFGTPPKKSNLRIVLLVVLGLVVVAGAVYAGVKIGKKQIQPNVVAEPTIVPTTIPQETEVSPAPDETASWKTYESINYYSIKYPSRLKSDGEDWVYERQKVFAGSDDKVSFGPPSSKDEGYIWSVTLSADICMRELISKIGEQLERRKEKIEDINVDGLPAKLVTVTSEGNEDIVYVAIFIIGDEYSYTYKIISNNGNNFPGFNAFYKSFHYTLDRGDENIPPGCLMPIPRKPGELPILGGCFTKNLVKDVKVTPEMPCCLRIAPNNCTPATLMVENRCTKDKILVLEGKRLDEAYSYFVFTKDVSGRIVEIPSDSAITYPEKDEQITLNGTFDNQSFVVTYTYTRKLCD